VFLVTACLALPPVNAPVWIVVFGLLGAALLGVLGIIAGIVSDKFDQLAAFQNFIIMPATFLSGVFYSVHGLAPFWQWLSRLNPFFYMIDGFRYGFFAQSDVDPRVSLAVVCGSLVLAATVAIRMLASGYKLRG
jgi:ABC-2 type transport system permease protein